MGPVRIDSPQNDVPPGRAAVIGRGDDGASYSVRQDHGIGVGRHPHPLPEKRLAGGVQPLRVHPRRRFGVVVVEDEVAGIGLRHREQRNPGVDHSEGDDCSAVSPDRLGKGRTKDAEEQQSMQSKVLGTHRSSRTRWSCIAPGKAAPADGSRARLIGPTRGATKTHAQVSGLSSSGGRGGSGSPTVGHASSVSEARHHRGRAVCRLPRLPSMVYFPGGGGDGVRR